jgi:hypothetical protein
MRLIVRSGPGKVELSWMFLPAFLAYDATMKGALEKKLAGELVGKPLNSDTLDWAHEQALDFICDYHKAIKGLRDFLDAIKFVETDHD